MAERERLTNKERRAQAREERKRKEAEEAAKRKRNQLRNGLITVVAVAVVGAVVLQAFLGGPDTIEDQILVSADDAAEARTAAGCEMLVEREPFEDRGHFDQGNAPEADAIYTGLRPTHSGPHSPTVIGVGAYDRQMNEVVSTHNLEHGSVSVWYDEGAEDAEEIASWARSLNASGFEGRQGSGVGILASPYEDPGFEEEDTTVAFRAWGTAMDCEEWDEEVANEFVARNFGTRGVGPERTFAPYPEEVLDIEGADIGDTTPDEAPTGDGHEPTGEVEGDDATDGEDGTDDAEDDADADADADDAGDDTEG